MRMDWKKLISSRRFRDDDNKTRTRISVDARDEFERDIDRIIFSFAFRRLQGKTQVFPIPKSDFIHTRLTHSLEVAAAGRQLGKLAGKFILKQEGELLDSVTGEKIKPGDFGNVLAAACLAHDIGNPPIGHSGEDAFRRFFIKNESRIMSDFKLTKDHIADFQNFEGNANGFRLLSNDHASGVPGGLRMTYTTLGAFSKYPKQSGTILPNELGLSINDRVSLKEGKFGFFQKEKVMFKEVAEANGLLRLSDDQLAWCRHPLAFLVEAADTICYSCIDIEDGFHLGAVSYKDVEEYLLPFAGKVVAEDPCNPEEELTKIIAKEEKVGFLRARAINNLAVQSFRVFESEYEKIMHGKFDSELTDYIELTKKFDELKNFNKKSLYNTPKGVQIEIAGYTILGGLLEHFIQALQEPDQRRSKKIVNLVQETSRPNTDNAYLNILRVCDFISGMTDDYAMDIYGKLTGSRFPIID
jgi:dGTPase